MKSNDSNIALAVNNNGTDNTFDSNKNCRYYKKGENNNGSAKDNKKMQQ